MRALNLFVKGFYWPLCRSYARLRGNRPSDRVLRTLCMFQFWLSCGFWPDFEDPKRFSEKVWCLQLFCRDPRLTVLSDKLEVRDYVARKAGPKYLVPLIWSGRDPEGIPFDRLPARCIIKTNHGCGFLIRVDDNHPLDRRTAIGQLRKWLRINYCTDTFLGIAWAYKQIIPRVIVEELLEENGTSPTDYKFWCFGGRVEFVSLHFDRFSKHSTLSFDREMAPGGLHFDLPTFQGQFTAPDNFREMVNLAEKLAEDFAFMRVDFYNVNGRIYFGEMTPYPGGVTTRFEPDAMDCALGAKWPGKGLTG